MADEMLARLDQLQRGAREIHPRRQEYDVHDEYNHYGAYGDGSDYYDGDDMYADENAFQSDTHGTQLCSTLVI
jgi:hypothetical protein